MPTRNASAIWEGGLKNGKGSFRGGSGSISGSYSFGTRFENAPGSNPNGSEQDIAAVANEAGNVFGLMPHPEHAVDPLTDSIDGLALFESLAVAVAN